MLGYIMSLLKQVKKLKKTRWGQGAGLFRHCAGIQTITPPPPPHGALTKRLLCRHFRYSLLLYMVHVVFKTATQVGKLTPCSISVSSRLRLRHLAAASLFLSRLTLLFSSSSGVNCMHNRSDELPCRHRNSF